MTKKINLYLVSIIMLGGWTKTYAEFPGGYFGFGIHIGTGKTIGAQVSLGAAMPFGDPRHHPYLFPGIAIGVRRSFSKKTSYAYIDLQLTYFNYGKWFGVGIGRTDSDYGLSLRYKIYGGSLFGGLTLEGPLRIIEDKKSIFWGGYLGMAYPLEGSNFKITTHI